MKTIDGTVGFLSSGNSNVYDRPAILSKNVQYAEDGVKKSLQNLIKD